MSQYCYFGIFSRVLSIAEISLAIGLEPDSSRVRASRSVDPPRPVTNVWRVEAGDRNTRVDDQLVAIVARLHPFEDKLAALASHLSSDPAEEGGGAAALQVV